MLFCGCGSLKNLPIGSSVKSIGRNAFSWTGFVDLEIPDTITSIGIYAFASCPALKVLFYLKI